MPHDEEEQLPSKVERKHVIKRYRRRYGEHWRWVCEIWKPNAKKASLTVMRLCATDTLQATTKEAERLVGVMIKNGGRIPPSETGTDVSFDAREGLDGFNPKSDSGKRMWCETHWDAVKDLAIAGTHNCVFASIFLTSRFTDRVQSDGLLIGGPGTAQQRYAIEMLRDSYSPICCWLGEAEVAAIIEASSVEALKNNPELAKLDAHIAGFADAQKHMKPER
jgi:hypothetical protein